MKLYVAMTEDRHTDVDAQVFSTPELAIEFARARAHEWAGRPEDYEEESIGGWLFYARYSVEDDSVWVVERELDIPSE